MRRFIKILPPLAAGLGGIFLFGKLGLPGGSFTGAMTGAAAVRLLLPAAEVPPRKLQSFARVILGVSIGISVNPTTLRLISASLFPISLMIAGLISLSYFAAWGATKIWGLPLVSSLCGSSPGAASAMVILTDDLGGNAPLVAVLHVLRIIAIVSFMPLLMSHFPVLDLPSVEIVLENAAFQLPTKIPPMLIFLVGGLPLAALFLRWKVPAAEILAGIVITALINPLLFGLGEIPNQWQFFSMWIIGTAIGAQMTPQALRSMGQYIFMSLVLTLVLIGIGLILGLLLYATGSFDLHTALIGSCPGALEAMIILAGETGADVPMVAAMHTARLVVVMITLPFLVRRVASDPMDAHTIEA